MNGELKKFYITLLIIAGCIFLLLMTISVPIFTSGSDFSLLNTGWNGCSDVAKKEYDSGTLIPNYEVQGTGEDISIAQRSITDFKSDPGTSAIVILGPKKGFTDEEAEYVRSFLGRGGTLLLADDFGTGNDLLGKIGAGSRFHKSPFVSLSFTKTPSFPVVQEIKEPFNGNVSHIMLNNPTVILPGANTTVYANTTYGWLDVDGDLIQGENEESGTFPILVVEDLLGGKLVLLSDPSVLINSMLERADNRDFSNNLFEFVIPQGGSVLFDEGHSGSKDGLVQAGLVLTSVPPVLTLFIVIGFLAVVVYLSLDLSSESIEKFRSDPRFKAFKERLFKLYLLVVPARKPVSEDAYETVIKKHPEWDRLLLKELIESTGQEEI